MARRYYDRRDYRDRRYVQDNPRDVNYEAGARDQKIRDYERGQRGGVATSDYYAYEDRRAEDSIIARERAKDVVWYIVGVLEIVLGLRLVLLILGAANVGFASFIYGISRPFVTPFAGMFATTAIPGGIAATIAAMIVYALIGWLIVALINLFVRPRRDY